jgi:hypothetical protein
METNIDQIMTMAKSWNPPQKKPAGRKSKLNPYVDTIRYMRSARHLSYKDIHAFVLETGMKVSYPTFLNFVKKKFNKTKLR